ncbi:MAG: 5-carboxymethyl-2-hydroxymuconate isomerase [Woeseiaceae bacterium]|nr:5-carboxymethyl-2-hydroxymuconate isomerase [Woeseiaceae bacterium]
MIEYSANLEAHLDISKLVERMHETAVGLDALPVGGIRTRAARRDVYRVADSHPDNTFINVTLRIAPRPAEVRQEVGEALFQALRDFVQPVFDRLPMALSLEVQEIDADFRWKHSNIRDYLAKRNN